MDITITIVDEQNEKEPLCYKTDHHNNIEILKDFNHGSVANTEPAKKTSTPLTIQQIQEHVAQQSGLVIQPNHITRALQFLAPSTKQETITPSMLGTKSIAPALFLAEYWNVQQNIKQQLGKTMFDNGYMELVCKHIAQTKEKNSLVVTSLIPFIDAASTECYKDISPYIEKKTLKHIYNAMYASDEFQDLTKQVTPMQTRLDKYTSWVPFERASSECTDEQLTSIEKAATKWKELPITRLFSALYPHDIGQCLYRYLICRTLSEKEQGIKGILNILTSENMTCNNSGVPTHMFTHIPLIYISKILRPKSSLYYFDLVRDPILCAQDKKVLKISRNQTYTRVDFSYCALPKLPKIETLKTCAHAWTFPKEMFEGDGVHKMLAPYAYKVTETIHKYHYIDKKRYHFMPSYWPWLKLGSCLLFAGCTLAATYYFYKQMQTHINHQEAYIAGRPAYIQEHVMQQVTPQTAPVYKYVIENKYAHDTAFSQTMHDALHGINQAPASNPAHMIHQDYLTISSSIKPLYNYWTNVPFDGIFTGMLKMAGTSLYGSLISIKQWIRFRYGSPRRDDIDEQLVYIGKIIFEPLLLIETLFGLNKPETIIRIPK